MNEQLIPITQIHDNPNQHREHYEDIEGLGRAIAEVGLQQAPKARKNGKGYELKFGHRRLRAIAWLSKNWKAEGLTDRYNGYTVMPLDVEEISDREMFDAMVIENIHRKDLKPTELAFLLKRYQERYPEATSKDLGVVFGMNDATVRGKVRLLDLPATWQKSLDAGKISEGVARAALGAQKVFSTDVMTKMLAKIEEGIDEDGDPVEAGTVIANELRWNGDVEDMWTDGRDGKPRSCWQNGWLLDMKNFPNKLLAPLTLEEATKALDVNEKDTQTIAAINTWLFSRYDQIEDADQNQAYAANALGLERVSRLEHMIHPTSCTACPFYSKIYSTHYCGMKVCWTRKMAAWRRHTIEMASRDLNIPVYEEKDGKYKALDSNQSVDKRRFNARHADLRLIDKERVRGYQSQYDFKGVNTSVFYVVATGKALEEIKADKALDKTPEEYKPNMKAERVREQMLKDKLELIMWESTLHIKSIFEGWKLEALRVLSEAVLLDENLPDGVELPEDTDQQMAESLRRNLAWEMVNESCDWKIRAGWLTVSQAAEELTTLAKNWGVKLPASFKKMATQMDEEIDSVAVETKAKSSVKGNGSRK